MPSPRPPIVLVAVDTSRTVPLAVQQAVTLARAMGAALHLVQVVEAVPTMALGGSCLLVASHARLLQQAWVELERWMATAGTTLQEIRGHVLAGDPVTRILQLATDLEADVLVIGTHDPGKVEHLLFGSVAEELAREAPCPVFVVRARRHAPPDVTGVDPPHAGGASRPSSTASSSGTFTGLVR